MSENKENSKTNRIPDTVTYAGDCDMIRTSSFNWKEFGEDGIELIVGKKYEVVDSHCMQSVLIKTGDEIKRDLSGIRYLYHKIPNEQGELIYVWEGFFEENSNL